jgi:hypothetical protein
MSKKSSVKKVVGKKPLPLKVGDKVKCIARKKIPIDHFNYMDGPGNSNKIELGKIYTIDLVERYFPSKELVVRVNGKK